MKEHMKEKMKKKMKKGGHVEGEKGKKRLDKYARGGAAGAAAMTPTSPLSGAGKMDKAPKGIKTDEADD